MMSRTDYITLRNEYQSLLVTTCTPSLSLSLDKLLNTSLLTG